MSFRIWSPAFAIEMCSDEFSLKHALGWTNCHKSNFYLWTAIFPSIQLPFEHRTCFIKCEDHL